MTRDYNNIVRIIKRNGTQRITEDGSVNHIASFEKPIRTNYGRLYQISYTETWKGSVKVNDLEIAYIDCRGRRIHRPVKPTNYRWIYLIYTFFEKWGILADYDLRG